MTYLAKPPLHHPSLEKNSPDPRAVIMRAASRRWRRCGHDSISASIIQACFEIDLAPHRLAKFSGIGCSSKTPDYFVSPAHGFNAVHGRMPSVLTGANIAAKGSDLSWRQRRRRQRLDRSSASSATAVRRGVNMTYICENTGVCMAPPKASSPRRRQRLKSQEGRRRTKDTAPSISSCSGAATGRDLRGRSFSGDKHQLVPLIKALSHKGTSFIDVISPCVAFNNHVGSTKSFDYVREHNSGEPRGCDQSRAPIAPDYKPGELKVVQHDGSILRLRKIEDDYDATNRNEALGYPARKAAGRRDRHGPALRRSRGARSAMMASTPWIAR